jgi:hypothetical protein
MILFCRSRARDGFVSVSELSAVRTRWFGSVKKCLAGKWSDLWGRSGVIRGGAYSALLIKSGQLGLVDIFDFGFKKNEEEITGF